MFVKQLRLMLPLCLLLYSCAKEREGWDKYVHASDVLDAQEKITAEVLEKHISTLHLMSSKGVHRAQKVKLKP